MSAYDDWKTTEPETGRYDFGDSVECPGCDRILDAYEYRDSGCEHCGAPPPVDDDDTDTPEAATAESPAEEKEGESCE